MPNTLRIHLAGCGRWGRHILRDLLALGCEVQVAAPSAATREYALSAGASHAAAELGELGGCEGIVVATPTSTHGSVTAQALAWGVPVFVEKPLAIDALEARAIAESAPGRVFVMDKWRYHPGIEELAQIARSGELGRPLGMHLRYVGWGQAHTDVDVT